MTERPGTSTGVTDGEGGTRTGLSEDEAARRLARHGPNAVPHPEPPGVLSRVLAQLRDPMIMLLCGALVVAKGLRASVFEQHYCPPRVSFDALVGPESVVEWDERPRAKCACRLTCTG